jgi:hypothetical protein
MNLLDAIGIYGWGAIERKVVASIAGRYSILLMGAAGTAKTEAAKRIFAALDRAATLRNEAPLPWGYRNASTAQIEDMTGFPLMMPADEAWAMHQRGETPGMIYTESPMTVRHYVYLVADEVNRINLMTQNKWFSLINERQLDGTKTDIECIIACMNPPLGEYEGTEPLDRAFADRFLWLIKSPSFWDMSTEDRKKVTGTRMRYRQDKDFDYGVKISDEACLALYDAVNATKKEQEVVERNHGRDIESYVVDVMVSLGVKGGGVLTDIGKEVDSRRISMIAQGIAGLHAAGRVLHGSTSIEDDALEALTGAFVQEAMGEKAPDIVMIRAAHGEHSAQLVGKAASLRAHLSKIQDPTERVGYAINNGADQELLSDTIMAAHNHYSAIDPVITAAFSYALYQRFVEAQAAPLVLPIKNVLEELAADVFKMLSAVIELPALSMAPGLIAKQGDIMDLLLEITEARKTGFGRAAIALASMTMSLKDDTAERKNAVVQMDTAIKNARVYEQFGASLKSATNTLDRAVVALNAAQGAQSV